MRLSQLIKELEELLKEHGDLELEDNYGEAVESVKPLRDRGLHQDRGRPIAVVGGP
jgi:hypothetical protein